MCSLDIYLNDEDLRVSRRTNLTGASYKESDKLKDNNIGVADKHYG